MSQLGEYHEYFVLVKNMWQCDLAPLTPQRGEFHAKAPPFGGLGGLFQMQHVSDQYNITNIF